MAELRQSGADVLAQYRADQQAHCAAGRAARLEAAVASNALRHQLAEHGMEDQFDQYLEELDDLMMMQDDVAADDVAAALFVHPWQPSPAEAQQAKQGPL
jgi:hypothetical protein